MASFVVFHLETTVGFGVRLSRDYEPKESSGGSRVYGGQTEKPKSKLYCNQTQTCTQHELTLWKRITLGPVCGS